MMQQGGQLQAPQVGLPWPLVGVTFDSVNGLVQVPTGHPLHLLMPVCGVLNQAGEFEMSILTMYQVAIAVCSTHPMFPNDLDNIFHGLHEMIPLHIFESLSRAVANGFAPNINTTFDVISDSHQLVRAACKWAQSNHNFLRPLLATDFAALPNLQAAMAGAQRFKISYSMVKVDDRYFGITELYGLLGWIHSAASRNATSSYTYHFETLANMIPNLAAPVQAMGVANMLVTHGVPTECMTFPRSAGNTFAYLKHRVHYSAGTTGDQREGFSLALPLILSEIPVLALFLRPSNSVADSVASYQHLVTRVHAVGQSPPERTLYHFHTAKTLATYLQALVHIPAAAALRNPPGDATYMASAAVLEFVSTAAAIHHTNQGAAQTAIVGVTNTSTPAYKQLIANVIRVQPWFVGGETRAVQAHAANPSNDFVIILIALELRNVFINQLVIGKTGGMAELSPLLRLIEGARHSFPRYVTNLICIDKNPGPLQGTRPDDSLGYIFPEVWLKGFLSDTKDKFVQLPWLEIACSIKQVRAKLAQFKVPYSASSGMFSEALTIPVLKELQHLLDVFGYARTGPGSLAEGLDRCAEFQLEGLSLEGTARDYHFQNVGKAFEALIEDLFDSINQFSRPTELAQAQRMVDPRVFPVAGAFDKLLLSLTAKTANLNQMIQLNPALFSALMAGASSSVTPTGSTVPGPQRVQPVGGKVKNEKGKGKSALVRFKAPGSLIFGQGDSGPMYNIKACMDTLKAIDQTLNRGSFCLSFFLSTKGGCTEKGHKPNCTQHQFSSDLKGAREGLEHKPCRVDAGAKPAK